MKKFSNTLFFSLIFFISISVSAQTSEEKINSLTQELNNLETKKEQLYQELETFKLAKLREDLKKFGLPKTNDNEEIINHSAMSLVYSEQHEQAKWVAHIILPDIINGKEGRTNDFREDSLVKTGSATEIDYFLKTKKEDGKYEYDGFGYDRGHLAPSADFRWSKKALSESYLYSNMSPQLADFNRGKWGDLEDVLRGYIYSNPSTQLYVVSGPLLNDSLPKIERGVNKVSIPKYYYKVVMDITNKKAIGFIMPNTKIEYPIINFAVSINEVEKATGIDFFYQLDDELEEKIETQNNYKDWVPEKQKNDIPPLYQPDLPKGVYNTIQAKRLMGGNNKVTIAGTVVSAKETRNGHVFLNLDLNYPNHIFTIAIWKQNLVNFSYDPLKTLIHQQIYVKGKITDFDGMPTMVLENEKAIDIQPKEKFIMVIGDED
ncbi:MAG: DNA/RNA non-specific endonuclease [Bacteroidetes bacterium HGW-Bacteroidetes-12]|jgi:endonuclease G|nr:MAG: DNA/RNA non-specific endonuclease [Bacteroidetes bacterium HGW-Bacteroidetes-12]